MSEGGIKNYKREEKYFAVIAVPPGETIKDFLEANDMTQVELVKRLEMSKQHDRQ